MLREKLFSSVFLALFLPYFSPVFAVVKKVEVHECTQPILLKKNNKWQVVSTGEVLHALEGDILEISQGKKMKKIKVPHDLDYSKTLNSARDEFLFTFASRKPDPLTCNNIVIKVLKPEIFYAEIFINGELVVARPGQSLSVKKTDQFRVLRFVTNFDSAEDVRFQLQPIARWANATSYEMRFMNSQTPVDSRLNFKIYD